MSYPVPVHKLLFAVLILCLVSTFTTSAQITSATANRVDSLVYPVSPAKDPLFIFYQTHQGFVPGSLTATLPGTDLYNFDWSKYNPAIYGFDPPFSSDTDIPTSTVLNLEEGGYSVRVWNGTTTDITMVAWVLQDHLQTTVEKTEDDLLPSYKFTCDFVIISGAVSPDTLFYYDLVSHDPITQVADYRFKWTSDNSELKIPNDTTVLDPNITFQPPYEDTWYILTATDEYGMVDVDSVFYISIQTAAEFTLEYWDKVAKVFDPDLNGDWSNPTDEEPTGSTDARLTVKFINESKNGATFEWVYLDTLGGIKENETTYDLEANTEFTYERADEYFYPFMVSTSEEGCIDTFKLDEPIFVQPVDLRIPNVFTPNADGTNDYWVFKHQSLARCKVAVMDRTGKVVYKIQIEDIYTWEGWDGNMHDSNRTAPEGQYYFVVEALGYDGVEYRDPYIYDSWKIFGGSGNTDQDPGTDPGQTQETQYTGWLYLYRHKGSF